MSRLPSANTVAGLDLNRELLSTSVTYQNISQEFIVTTSDKVKLCLGEHREALRSRTEWVAPAGILASIGTTLVVADFNVFLGFGSDFWRALYMIASGLSIVWLLHSLYHAAKAWRRGGVDHIVASLKADTVTSVASAQCTERARGKAGVLEQHNTA